jgi:hypothetical protein
MDDLALSRVTKRLGKSEVLISFSIKNKSGTAKFAASLDTRYSEN